MVAKGLRNTKFYTTLSVLVMLTVTLSISPTIASLMDSVTIRSSGIISTTKVTARSGSPEDIQEAVDAVAAAGGGTVYIPEGDFAFNPSQTWLGGEGYGVHIPGGVNVIGQGKGKTILRETQDVFKNPTEMFRIDGAGKSVRISGISFIGHVTGEIVGNLGLRIENVKDLRVDHCSFEDFNSQGIYVENSRGVIDHCDFDNPYHDIIPGYTEWGYGIIVTYDYVTWVEDINSLLGHYDGLDQVIYIEDCTFSRCRHAIASNGGGYYVVRHCTLEEPRPPHYYIVDIHGVSGEGGIGGRGLEAYDNIIKGCEYRDPITHEPTGYWHSIAFCLRGGGGVIFNNTIIDCEWGITLSLGESGQQERCKVKDLYIWNNQMMKQNAPSEGTYIGPDGFTEGVDYFLKERVGYTPYPYPHPLTLETTP